MFVSVRRCIASIILVALLISCSAKGDQETAGIRIDELDEHMSFLAADERAGRFPGSRGIAEAEDYIASRFDELGLEHPPGFSNYFDRFTLQGVPWDLESSLRISNARFYPGTDFAPLRISGEAQLEAEVTFVGYGIEAEEFDHHDYRGLDVAGKLVIALRHEPEEKSAASAWKGTEFTDYATFLTKARLARQRGAVGFLTFTDPLHHAAEESFHITHSITLEGRNRSENATLDGFPALMISRQLAQELLRPLLAENGISLNELQHLSDDGRRPSVDAELPQLRIDLRRRGGATLSARNVGGLYRPPGGGRSGTVVVGAHHDHLGGTLSSTPARDTIFNGADDNASGVTALLEIAEELVIRQPDLPYKVLFVTFSAEEAGLLGSRSLSNRLPDGLGPYLLMLNLDMVGRNPGGALEVYQAGLDATQLDQLKAIAAEEGLNLDIKQDKETGTSDHSSFRRIGVPVLFFFTGFHTDYHQVSDETENIVFNRLKKVADLAADYLISGIKP